MPEHHTHIDLTLLFMDNNTVYKVKNMITNTENVNFLAIVVNRNVISQHINTHVIKCLMQISWLPSVTKHRKI